MRSWPFATAETYVRDGAPESREGPYPDSHGNELVVQASKLSRGSMSKRL